MVGLKRRIRERWSSRGLGCRKCARHGVTIGGAREPEVICSLQHYGLYPIIVSTRKECRIIISQWNSSFFTYISVYSLFGRGLVIGPHPALDQGSLHTIRRHRDKHTVTAGYHETGSSNRRTNFVSIIHSSNNHAKKLLAADTGSPHRKVAYCIYSVVQVGA